MEICLIGLNKAAIPPAAPRNWPERIGVAVGVRDAASPIRELVTVETEQRIELYAAISNIADPFAVLCDAVGTASDHAIRPSSTPMDLAMGSDAALHLLHIASGNSAYDDRHSMAAKLQTARECAERSGRCGDCLADLFDTAKRIAEEMGDALPPRNETAAAVAELCERLFGSANRTDALIVGDSELEGALAEALEAKGFRVARKPAWPETPESASKFGIIATSQPPASGPLGTKDLKTLRRLRRGRPFAIFDMTVGRAVAPNPKDIDDIFVYGIDDLQELAGAKRAGPAASPAQRRRLLRNESRALELRWKRV